MNKELICHVDMFAFSWLITLDDQPVATLNLSHFGEEVVKLCEENNINTFHLIGNEKFSQMLVEDIEKAQIAKYSNNEKIRIEVN